MAAWWSMVRRTASVIGTPAGGNATTVAGAGGTGAVWAPAWNGTSAHITRLARAARPRALT